MITLFPDQQELKSRVVESLHSHQDVLMVLPTGGGKTAIFSDIIRDQKAPVLAIAHRQEIVSQISLSLAKNEIRHQVMSSNAVIKNCRARHLDLLGKNYVEPNASTIVAGVDTLIRRPVARKVGLIVMDEAHHVTKKNKWGKAREMYPNAKCLHTTATPLRADGQGLGRHASGYIDILVEGLTFRELVNLGRLADYRIFAPKSDIDETKLTVGSNGDYTIASLAASVRGSHIVGDVVSSYIKFAKGKRGLTFCVSVEEATKQAMEFNRQGIPAEVVSAKTPDDLRTTFLRKLERGELLQLVNVDLFGEGMDCPGVEVVSMARKTESFALFAQQFGRPCRVAEGKSHAIIIDHVGNTLRHGVPDASRVWSLDDREKRGSSQVSEVLVKLCENPECISVYEAYRKSCPYCGHVKIITARSAPEYVEGDMYELDPEVLRRLGREIDSGPKFPRGATHEIMGHLKKAHAEKVKVQQELRESIAQWAGRISTSSDKETVAALQRRFYFKFGIDVANAQMLNAHDGRKLIEKIRGN